MIIQNIQLKNSSFMQKIKESTIGRQVEPAIPVRSQSSYATKRREGPMNKVKFTPVYMITNHTAPRCFPTVSAVRACQLAIYTKGLRSHV